MSKFTKKKKQKLIGKLDGLLPVKDWKPTLIEHFKNDSTFLPHRIQALQSHINTTPDVIKQIIKGTRTGHTTNFVMGGLDLDRKLLIVEPTNAIGEKTVVSAIEKYITATGRKDIIVRPILSNELVCTELDGKYEKKRKEIHIPVVTPKCEDCEAEVYKPKAGEPQYPILLKTGQGYCVLKTMMKEEKEFKKRGEVYAPDVVYTTHEKLNSIRKSNSTKNEFYNRLIGRVTDVLWDEFSKYLQQSSGAALIYEIAHKRDGTVIEGSELDIKMQYAQAIEFIEKNELEINESTLSVEGQQASVRAKHCIEKFIKPNIRSFDALKSSETPANHVNELSLFKELIEKKNGEKEEVFRYEYLQRTLEEQVETIEALEINEEGRTIKEYILSLFAVLQENEIVVQKSKGTEHIYHEGTVPNVKEIHVYAERKSITLSTRQKLQMFAEYVHEHPEQNITISDATLGKIDLSNLSSRHKLGENNRKHIIEYWGDPANTNAQQFMFRYVAPNSKHPTFSSESWKHKPGHREEFLKQIGNATSVIGIENSFLIAPNIEVHNDVSRHHKDTKLPITYYNASDTRGVESDKNISYALGVARKPKGAYEAAMLGQLALYLPSYIDDAGLEQYASNQGMNLKQFKERIELFSYPPISIYERTVPAVLRPLFDYVVEEHQKSIVAQDTRQAIDRSKDPRGEKPSAVIMFGVSDNDARDIVNLGAEVVSGYAGNKRSKSKKYKILPPRYKVISDFSDVKIHMAGGEVNVPVSGYDKDFTQTLYKALVNNHGNRIDQDEILTNYGGDIKVDHNTGDKYDAFIVAVINIQEEEIKTHGIKIHKTGNRYKMYYVLSLDKDFNMSDIEHAVVTSQIGENAITILKDASKRKEKKYSRKTAINYKLALTREEFIEAMNFIHENNILRGTSWKIDNGIRGDKVILKS